MMDIPLAVPLESFPSQTRAHKDKKYFSLDKNLHSASLAPRPVKIVPGGKSRDNN